MKDNYSMKEGTLGAATVKKKNGYIPTWLFVLISLILVGTLIGGFIYGKAEADRSYDLGYEDGRESMAILRETIRDLNDEIQSHNEELSFWREHAVICTTEGTKYHHYGCPHIEGRRFYIYNIENAEYYGYQPCLDCCN